MEKGERGRGRCVGRWGWKMWVEMEMEVKIIIEIGVEMDVHVVEERREWDS